MLYLLLTEIIKSRVVEKKTNLTILKFLKFVFTYGQLNTPEDMLCNVLLQ